MHSLNNNVRKIKENTIRFPSHYPQLHYIRFDKNEFILSIKHPILRTPFLPILLLLNQIRRY